MSFSEKVTILCSGVHLGVYVPGMLVEKRLRQLGVPADVETIETYYKPADRERLEQLRDDYHQNFRLALMARRMTHDIQSSLDDDLLEEMFEFWIRDKRRYFILWSGFWLPLIARYRRRVNDNIYVDHCRIDAVVSPSFEIYSDLCEEGRVVWFWNGAAGRLENRVPINGGPTVAFQRREDRCVVHGGGWGVGTYRSKIPELQAAGLALDIIAYNAEEIQNQSQSDRVFMVDPSWRPWMKNANGRHLFPPFGEMAPGTAKEFSQRSDRHELISLVTKSIAVISKPGGGTLIDCLESATPLVMLEPYGYAEEANGVLWQHLGLGITYQTWQESGFSRNLLEGCHEKLLKAREQTPDYCRAYADDLLSR
jgi:hypothetical protein